VTAKTIDLFAYQMEKERVHPAKLTAKQIELRREYCGNQWAKFERDQSDLDQMASWIAEQFETAYHQPIE